jgi:hypothetical protein
MSGEDSNYERVRLDIVRLGYLEPTAESVTELINSNRLTWAGIAQHFNWTMQQVLDMREALRAMLRKPTGHAATHFFKNTYSKTFGSSTVVVCPISEPNVKRWQVKIDLTSFKDIKAAIEQKFFSAYPVFHPDANAMQNTEPGDIPGTTRGKLTFAEKYELLKCIVTTEILAMQATQDLRTAEHEAAAVDRMTFPRGDLLGKENTKSSPTKRQSPRQNGLFLISTLRPQVVLGSMSPFVNASGMCRLWTARENTPAPAFLRSLTTFFWKSWGSRLTRCSNQGICMSRASMLLALSAMIKNSRQRLRG